MKTICSLLFVLLFIVSPVKADEVMNGYLIRQDDGTLMACTTEMNGKYGCFRMFQPMLECTAILKPKVKLVCPVIES